VLVLTAFVDVEITENLSSEKTFREHALNCMAYDSLITLVSLDEFCWRIAVLSAWIT
jgi:hypothetical protein